MSLNKRPRNEKDLTYQERVKKADRKEAEAILDSEILAAKAEVEAAQEELNHLKVMNLKKMALALHLSEAAELKAEVERQRAMAAEIKAEAERQRAPVKAEAAEIKAEAERQGAPVKPER